MKRKNRTILLTSVISSIPLLAAGGYFGIKYSSVGDGTKSFDKQQPNDKLQGNGTKQNQSKDHISDFNFNNPVPKPKPKKDPLPLEIPKSPKPINILEDKITPFKPKKEIDKPIKITKAPHIEVKQSEIPTPKPNPNNTPSTRTNSSSNILSSIKNFFNSSSSSSSSTKFNRPTPTWKLGSGFKGGKTLTIHGVVVEAEYEEVKQREVSASDDDIKNWKGYQAQIVPGSVRVKVTDKLIQGAIKDAGTALKNHFPDSIKESFKPIQGDPQGRINLIKISWESYFKNKFEKYERLFMSDNVKNYLNEEGKRKYENNQIPSVAQAQSDPDKKIERFLELFLHFEYSKVTKVSNQVKKYLEEGLFIEPDNPNVYINEQGELDSYAFSPTHNTVTSRMSRDNKEKRAFGFNEYWPIAPGKILNNEIPGWTKSADLSNTDEFKDVGISSSEGISIYKQIKKEDNKITDGVLKGAKEGLVLDIDASNSEGIKKAAQIIKKLESSNKKITQYRITNVGLHDNSNQNFKEIMESLPQTFAQLTLILEGSNTKFLRYLKEKKIDQLDLFTTKNNGVIDGKSWSINPWALKGVAWVNTNDYNSPMNYSRWAKIASRIVFNSLSFDQEDIIESNGIKDLKNINRGLRMAYYVRNNEGIFQGNFGNGLNPDHDEGNNSYPTELDLSNTNLKSLKGLIFHDEIKGYNKPRKLKKLTLKNNAEIFDISGSELDGANFQVLDLTSPGPPPTIISFSNGATTKKLKISGSESLTSDAIDNLQRLKKLADSYFYQNPEIYVDDDNSSLAQSLKSRGFRVVKDNSSTSTKLN